MPLLDHLLGRPLASSEEEGQRIGPLAGVPLLGLDALSSAAYGPEAALTVLLVLGGVGLAYIGPLTLTVVALLLIVYLSYRQTIAAYPAGGGSYTVAKENLGTGAGLLAAAALLLDYILNVAVGISAGVGAIISAAPGLLSYRLELCLLLLVLITLVNVRGTRETGAAFMLPTVLFVVCLGAVIVLGLVKTVLAGGHPLPLVSPPVPLAATGGVGLWLLLRAFASGCTALTGVEAVSNGVSAFRPPAVKNAQTALTLIVGLLALLLGGIAYLSRVYGIGATDPASPHYQSVLSMLTEAVAGRGAFYYVTSLAVLGVLCLGANTSFAGLPRVCRLLALDDYLPHAFLARGRRLVYTWGIGVLAVCAAALLIAFGGVTDRLIPLFAIGAFLAFTMSQAGMVAHWRRLRRGGAALFLNALGAVSTGVTLLVVLAAKFSEGAWLSVLLIPLFMLAFYASKRHYSAVSRAVSSTQPLDFTPAAPPCVIVPMRGWNAVTRKALSFAMQLSPDVRAVHVGVEEDGQRLQEDWEPLVYAPARAANRTPPRLIRLAAPYGRLTGPLIEYIGSVEGERPDTRVAVIIPELVEARWYHYLFHNQRATALKARLYFLGDPRVVVINVPWYLHAPPRRLADRS